jgi:hypothetical protein
MLLYVGIYTDGRRHITTQSVILVRSHRLESWLAEMLGHSNRSGARRAGEALPAVRTALQPAIVRDVRSRDKGLCIRHR